MARGPSKEQYALLQHLKEYQLIEWHPAVELVNDLRYPDDGVGDVTLPEHDYRIALRNLKRSLKSLAARGLVQLEYRRAEDPKFKRMYNKRFGGYGQGSSGLPMLHVKVNR